jgi:uncharacterized protein (DUF1501 family)
MGDSLMHTRRKFLRACAATPMACAGAPLLNLLSGPAAHAAGDDYRALVCVFLLGGMDCHDTVLPFDSTSYGSYARLRASLLDAYGSQPGGSSRERAALLPLEPATAVSGARQFALPPQLSGLHQLFGAGRAAIVGNVGPLIEPTTRQGFNSNGALLPARLFSHNDQQSTWMSFSPEGAQLGWGGRFGDAMQSAESAAASIFSQISLVGNTVFLNGATVSTYNINADGVPSIALIDAAGDRFSAQLQARVRDHFTAMGSQRENLFELDFVNLSRVSLDANDRLDSALRSAAALDTPFPTSPLGGQLRAVAETMALRQELGVSRQVFFVALGGFDTHSAQAAELPPLQQDIGDSIAAFYRATEELGLAEQVTTFTAADFGRTLSVNGDGTDHGWGSHHFVVGGAVRGGDIYGDIPVAELGHEQDAGNGRLIPTVSVEQFAAPLGRWFGLGETELELALPGLANFPAARMDFV